MIRYSDVLLCGTLGLVWFRYNDTTLLIWKCCSLGIDANFIFADSSGALLFVYLFNCYCYWMGERPHAPEAR